MVTTGVVVRVATLIALWIDLCQAQYSLYISEENLQTYYSNSPHEELVQGEIPCLLQWIIYQELDSLF